MPRPTGAPSHAEAIAGLGRRRHAFEGQRLDERKSLAHHPVPPLSHGPGGEGEGEARSPPSAEGEYGPHGRVASVGRLHPQSTAKSRRSFEGTLVDGGISSSRHLSPTPRLRLAGLRIGGLRRAPTSEHEHRR